jgi:UPF0716 protein FxsA
VLGYLILLFCAVPLVELYLLFALAGRIGPGPTFLLVIGTGIIGATLAKLQGFHILRRIQVELANQRMPTTSLVDGAMILMAGALLLTPGILTDLFGFSLLLPPVRAVYRQLITSYLRKHVQVHVAGMSSESVGRGGRDEIIDAQVVSTSKR